MTNSCARYSARGVTRYRQYKRWFLAVNSLQRGPHIHVTIRPGTNQKSWRGRWRGWDPLPPLSPTLPAFWNSSLPTFCFFSPLPTLFIPQLLRPRHPSSLSPLSPFSCSSSAGGSSLAAHFVSRPKTTDFDEILIGQSAMVNIPDHVDMLLLLFIFSGVW